MTISFSLFFNSPQRTEKEWIPQLKVLVPLFKNVLSGEPMK